MMLKAYAQASTRTETPRETEYRLFGQVTRALMHAATVDPSDVKTRIDALDWNRRLWSVLATDCSDPDNKLNHPLRAQIISISLFVSRHSSAVMRGEEDFQTLIDINRSIMQGLAPQSSQAA
ncbi:MAG: flagellar biosynthesis regulator FlaF [Brevundimonas sp.]|uniref:flagellar biosynthesis regulator FlaF n=1 Tax=Brevundimonas sp. TaxID=1871086 RepID=UPI002734EE44|nr:flagellar biosynthesis regulator FlaF [Brevundimonas sp.]MBX9616626.1 flagellar biosynthesis regulator FlaF [Caulobacteraceae bacterium]MDP3404460.1 flagellar biosynthesis regulator FlaF [Brevundimonas sp.]